ncbi:YlbG family protein [Paenibacillus farraposensis]|uniref:YlbG family protein n=1 Tax=Paenibacillus farraposensis TaxID=2807095 RepID=A0ABW4DAJ5_9BACL|nr:YlbG family protein [Paenibacillus farraposensis]MCC3379805.1 YlbG family protein [Paenibacillus farraposensis]
MFAERTGYIIWVSDIKAARNLEKYGNVHYISRRMHYVVIYMNADRAEDTVKNIRRLSYVRKVERSFRNEIRTEYNDDKGKMKEYEI